MRRVLQLRIFGDPFGGGGVWDKLDSDGVRHRKQRVNQSIYVHRRDLSRLGLALNPVILAFIVGLIFNLTGVVDKVSEIADYCEDFSLTVTPLAMTILGIKLGGIEWKRLFTQKTVYYISALRLLVFPIAITGVLLACHFAFELDKEVVLAIFVSISMPTATISSAFADTYHGDADGAAMYTLGSTVFSIATIPVLYWLLCVIL